MCDIDKEVCERSKSHFCEIFLSFAGSVIVGFVIVAKGQNLFPDAPVYNWTGRPRRNRTRPKPIIVIDDISDYLDSGERMPYFVGVGIADMTGPCVEIGFMGYVEPLQIGNGIHTRQFARSFIISNNKTRVVLVSAEIHVVGLALRREVVRNLEKMYVDVYNMSNVFISATHTFSTPGGFLGDFLLDVLFMGFSNEVFYAYSEGITRVCNLTCQSIVRAHTNMKDCRLYFAQSRVWNAHMNRNPTAYQKNPPREKAKYSLGTDNTLSQIRIMKRNQKVHGLMNFIAITANNLHKDNILLSTDNLGFAAMALEKELNPGLIFHSKATAVAAFFVTNAGDVTANTRGAYCSGSSRQCDNHFMRCDLGVAYCIPIGPAKTQKESAKIIGSGVMEGALRAKSSRDAIEISGGARRGILNAVYKYVQPGSEIVPLWDPNITEFNKSRMVNGCNPAFGDWYTYGTMDYAPTITLTVFGTVVGAVFELFGMNYPKYLTGSALIDAIANGLVMNKQTKEDEECQKPKTIMFATGRALYPVPWHTVSSVSVVNLGGLVYLAGVPGEVSTMAGRRIRAVIQNETGAKLENIVIMSNTNDYIHHIVTREEYQVQAFEGSGTLYGPNTLDIYLNKYAELAKVAKTEGEVLADMGIEPVDYKDQAVSLVKPAKYDMQYAHWYKGFDFLNVTWLPPFYPWGTVPDGYEPPLTTPTRLEVKCVFAGNNPRNDMLQEMAYFTIDKWDSDYSDWEAVYTDASWETSMTWSQDEYLVSWNEVVWDIPAKARYAYYRFHYFGVSRTYITGLKNYFEGTSRSFYVSYKY